MARNHSRRLSPLPDSVTPLSDDDASDEDFPLGDGTADTEATVHCPYCGEEVEIAIDPGGGEAQQYVQDCEICCQPWKVSLNYDMDGRAEVVVTVLDE